MSADRDVTRIVRSWLHEDAHEDADRILNLVLDEIDTTPQRRAGWLARRSPAMSNPIRLAVAAAVLVVVAFIGYQLLGGSNVGGPTETQQPTESSAAAELPVGSTHVLWDHAQDGLKIVVTIPAAGWFGNAGGGVLKKNDSAGAPDGAEVSVFAETSYGLVATGNLSVYGDPCHWAGPLPHTGATTVNEAIAALSAQPSRDASAPADVTYDGYAGKRITLHVPNDAVFSACDEGQFRTLASWSGNDGRAARAEDPGQFDLFTVLDVNGELVIFDLAYFEGAEGTPERVLDEMAGIMESAILQTYDP